MCGRFVRKTPLEEWAPIFGASLETNLGPAFNIAPSDEIAAVLWHARLKRRALVAVRWGLVPAWSRDTRRAARMINARAETLAEKPSFREAFLHRRCLIPADGFYEWQTLAGQAKQPVYIHPVQPQPLAFAGLYEHWRRPEGGWLSTCTIVTTSANACLLPIHERMPVLLPPETWELWLDPKIHAVEALKAVLQPAPDALLAFYPVSPQVSSVRFQGMQCLEPWSAEIRLSGFPADTAPCAR